MRQGEDRPAADVVVLIDMYRHAGGSGDRGHRTSRAGAAQVAQNRARNGDRAVIAALGGNRPRWAPTSGSASSYRVLEDTVLGAGEGFENTTGTLARAQPFPQSGCHCVFHAAGYRSPALALIDLRATRPRRGCASTFLIASQPLQDQLIPWWSGCGLCSAMYRDMATTSGSTLSWPADHSLQSIDGVAQSPSSRTGQS